MVWTFDTTKMTVNGQKAEPGFLSFTDDNILHRMRHPDMVIQVLIDRNTGRFFSSQVYKDDDGKWTPTGKVLNGLCSKVTAKAF